MRIYKYMYLHLFNKVSYIMEMLKKMEPSKQGKEAIMWLMAAQMECEDMYIRADEYLAALDDENEETAEG